MCHHPNIRNSTLVVTSLKTLKKATAQTAQTKHPAPRASPHKSAKPAGDNMAEFLAFLSNTVPDEESEIAVSAATTLVEKGCVKPWHVASAPK